MPLRAKRPATELILTMSATCRGSSSAAWSRWGSAACAVEKAEDVELDHLFPLGERGVDDRAEQHHAGVVDQRVQTPELTDGPCDGRGGLVLVGDIALQYQCRASATANFARDRFESVFAAAPASATAAPCAASAKAVAAPMPLDAPVTKATVPSNRSRRGAAVASDVDSGIVMTAYLRIADVGSRIADRERCARHLSERSRIRCVVGVKLGRRETEGRADRPLPAGTPRRYRTKISTPRGTVSTRRSSTDPRTRRR